MAIAPNPKGIPTVVDKERAAEAFIAKKAQSVAPALPPQENRKPTMIRIPPDLLTKIDVGARRMGISRSAFIVLSTAEKLERLG